MAESEYTPTLDELKRAYSLRSPDHEAAFDRAIERVRAEAAAEALDRLAKLRRWPGGDDPGGR